MIAKTPQGKEMRKYYVKLENINNIVVSEEMKEKEQQLQMKLEKLNKEKPLERHNILLREFSKIGSLVYAIKVKSFDDGSYIIRLGESRIGIKDRLREHKQNYEEAIILDCFLVKNSKNFESFLHGHDDIKFNKVTDFMGHGT